MGSTDRKFFHMITNLIKDESNSVQLVKGLFLKYAPGNSEKPFELIAARKGVYPHDSDKVHRNFPSVTEENVILINLFDAIAKLNRNMHQIPNSKTSIIATDMTELRPIMFVISDIDGDLQDELIFPDRRASSGEYHFGVMSVDNIPDNGDGSEPGQGGGARQRSQRRGRQNQGAAGGRGVAAVAPRRTQ